MRRRILLIVHLLLVLPTIGEPATPRLSEERVLLHTDAGDILLALYPDVAPRHVQQFLRLVQLGVYDTTHFARVEPGFVVQLSNAEDRRVPLTAEQRSAIRPIPAEFSLVPHTAGTLSMARERAAPDSAETSFSILLADAPHLDGKYTVFGHVEEGIGAIEEILKVPQRHASPVVRINVSRAEVVAADEPTPTLAPPRTIPYDRGAIWRELGDDDRAWLGAWGSPDNAPLPTADPLLLAGLGVITVGSLSIYFFARRLSSRFILSLALVNALVAGFIFFAVLAPLAATSQGLALVVFLGWLGLIRLMGRFESTT